MGAIEGGKVNIRPMQRRDISKALAIFKKIGGQSVLTYKDLVAMDLGGALDLSFVAEVNEDIVGFILARLAYVGVPVNEVGIVEVLLVDPDYRHQGIASKLINALFDRCHSEGVNTVRVVVSERDSELRNFFENLGFHRSELINYIKLLES